MGWKVEQGSRAGSSAMDAAALLLTSLTLGLVAAILGLF